MPVPIPVKSVNFFKSEKKYPRINFKDGTMGYYDSEKNVEQYIQMAEGYDGRYLIEKLERYLPEGSSVLELGMGPGKDLDLLNKKYTAAGSDNSDVFVNKYLKSNPGADVFVLDALTLDTDRNFDALYSNKVLTHLNYEQMKASFLRQSRILSSGGSCCTPSGTVTRLRSLTDWPFIS